MNLNKKIAKTIDLLKELHETDLSVPEFSQLKELKYWASMFSYSLSCAERVFKVGDRVKFIDKKFETKKQFIEGTVVNIDELHLYIEIDDNEQCTVVKTVRKSLCSKI